MYPPILRVHLKKDQRRTYLMMLMQCFFGFGFRQVDAILMGTHNICFYKEVDKMYTGCNLKTTELLDCALMGVCAVIRSNTVNLAADFWHSPVWLVGVVHGDLQVINGDFKLFATLHCSWCVSEYKSVLLLFNKTEFELLSVVVVSLGKAVNQLPRLLSFLILGAKQVQKK